MPLKHSCFISYRHPSEPKSPVRDLIDALMTEIGGRLQWRASFDENRLKPGYLLDENLAADLYHSACMVVIYAPHYFRPESTYCAREFFGMLGVERARRALLPAARQNTSFIIPIAFRGFTKMNEQIAQAEAEFCGGAPRPRIGVDLSSVQGPLTTRQKRQITAAVDQIEALCDLYDNWAQSGVNAFADALTFSLPNDATVKPWLPNVLGWGPLPSKEAA